MSHRSNYLKRLEKAKSLIDNIEVIIQDDEELHVNVTSSNSDEKYLVSCVDGIYHCDCTDFYVNGLNKDCGSFICKHIITTLFYLEKGEE